MHRRAWFAAALAVLLAGCDRPETEIGAPYAEIRSSTLPGVFTNATLYEEPDGSYRMEVLAVNEGTTTYHRSDTCVPPWTDVMEDEQGDRVEHREPTSHCAAFGLGPFPPGAREEATFEWDGRLWGPDGPRDAPTGSYTWRPTFEFYGDASGADPSRRERVSLELHLTLG